MVKAAHRQIVSIMKFPTSRLLDSASCPASDTIPDLILSTEEYQLLTAAVAAAEQRFPVALTCHLSINPLRRSSTLCHVHPPVVITITPRPRFPPQLLSQLLPLAIPNVLSSSDSHLPHESIHFHPDLLCTLQRITAEFGLALTIPEGLVRVALSLSERSRSPPTEEHIAQVLQSSVWPHLFPFQRTGVTCAIRSMSGRVLIADDMGMGKTLQALAISDYYRRSAPPQKLQQTTLILCPATLRSVWKLALIRWLPTASHLSVHVVKSPAHFQTLISASDHTHKDPWDNSFQVSYIVCAYDLLPRLQNCRACKILHCDDGDGVGNAQVFPIIIADECHLLKNPFAARTKAALPLLIAASTCILVSGTPALSRATDLFPLLKCIFHSTESPYFSYEQFLYRYCGGHASTNRITTNVEELHDILSAIMIRRLKAQMDVVLPPKHRVLISAHLQRESLCQISHLRERAQKISDVLSSPHDPQTAPVLRAERETLFASLYLRTAQVKLRPVLARLMKHLQRGSIESQGANRDEYRHKKVIVFAHHVQVLDAVECFVVRMGLPFVRVDGSLEPDRREEATTRFQYDATVRVAILSLQIASVGLTLTSADVVLFAELSWVPAMLAQAEDRVHRIGRTEAVYIEYVIVPGSLDDMMMSVLQDKQNMIGKAVDGARPGNTLNGNPCCPFSFTDRVVLSETEVQCILSDSAHDMIG